MRIVHDPSLAGWLVERSEQRYGVPFKDHAALGVISSSGEIMAVVVYDEYDPNNKTIQMSVAVEDPRCWTKSITGQLLSYAFDELKVYRVWFQTPHTNERLIKIAKIFGFTIEAVLKNHFGKCNAVIGRILLPNYRRMYK